MGKEEQDNSWVPAAVKIPYWQKKKLQEMDIMQGLKQQFVVAKALEMYFDYLEAEKNGK